MALSSDDLRIFLAVLDKGSFSAAARALGRVPSAVSMSIGLMEADLDLLLFDRSGREARPTSDALSLEPKARQIISQMRLFETHALSLHHGLERRLTLVVASELLSVPWSRPLAQLAEEYQPLSVDVLSAPQDRAMEMLHDKSADLAILFERPRIDERELFAEIGTETFVAVIAPGHPGIAGRGGEMVNDDLFSIRQIVVGKRDGATDPRFRLSHDVWYTDSHFAALSMVQEALGWAYLPKSLVQDRIEHKTLKEMLFPDFSPQVRLWVDVVWLKYKPLGVGAARLVELLRENACIGQV